MLAGSVATVAVIPDVIALSFAAGVDPQVGLHAPVVIGVVIAFAGGHGPGGGGLRRPGIAAPRAHAHALPDLLAAGLTAGAIQIFFGSLRLGVPMRFVSTSVRTGFVDALAHFRDVTALGALGEA